MAVEQVARWPWNAWPDESGLGGRMAWNPHPNGPGQILTVARSRQALKQPLFRESRHATAWRTFWNSSKSAKNRVSDENAPVKDSPPPVTTLFSFISSVSRSWEDDFLSTQATRRAITRLKAIIHTIDFRLCWGIHPRYCRCNCRPPQTIGMTGKKRSSFSGSRMDVDPRSFNGPWF